MIEGTRPFRYFWTKCVVGIVREARETHPLDAGIVRQIRGDRSRVGLVALEAQRQRLEPLKKLEGVEGRERRAGVAKLNGSGPHDEGPLGKVTGEHDVVKGDFGLIERRESLGVLGPGKRPAVDDRAAQRRAVPADELRERVHDDVGAVVKGFSISGVATVLSTMSGTPARCATSGDRLEVDDVARRIADRLDEDATGPLVDQRSDRLGLIVGGEARLDASVDSTWAK